KELVDNLLDMTAIEAGRLSVQTRVTDIARLVQSALNTIRQHHPGRRFDLRVDDGLPPVTADESHALQVLQNLLDNACKFSPEGSPIEVDVSARDEFVHVRVRDHGEGLEPDQTTQVFRKF